MMKDVTTQAATSNREDVELSSFPCPVCEGASEGDPPCEVCDGTKTFWRAEVQVNDSLLDCYPVVLDGVGHITETIIEAVESIAEALNRTPIEDVGEGE